MRAEIDGSALHPPRPGKSDRDSQNQRIICHFGSTALNKGNVTLGALAAPMCLRAHLRRPPKRNYIPIM